MQSFAAKVKAELKRNEFANLICHSLFDGFLIAEKGKIICCNENISNLFGYTEYGLQDKRFSLLFSETEKGKIRTLGKKGEDVFLGVKKSGESFKVRVRIKRVKYQGRELQFLVISDLSSVEGYKRIMKESQDRYRVLAESLLDGIFIVDSSGKILFANSMALQMLGFQELEDLLETPITQFVVPQFSEKVRQDIKLVFEDLGGFLIEYQLKDRSGGVFWVESIGKKTVFEGRDAGLLCLRDVTERKLAEEGMKRALSKSKKLIYEIVMALSRTIGEKDPYTAEHQRRVARLASAIAEDMHVSREIAEGLKTAALLHDIGKIYIPGEILTAPRKLTDVEMQLIRYHPVKGSQIVEKIEFPWPVSKIILQHHERLDGGGYAGSLKSDSILLEAKILAVADVVEAMSSHRPYRSALGIDVALEEIENNSGVLYDEKVVSSCLKIFEKGFSF